MFVFDQRLVQIGFALDHIDQVVHHTALTTHDQIQVAQADIEINHSGFVAAQGQARRKAGAGGGFSHPAFA